MVKNITDSVLMLLIPRVSETFLLYSSGNEFSLIWPEVKAKDKGLEIF